MTQQPENQTAAQKAYDKAVNDAWEAYDEAAAPVAAALHQKLDREGVTCDIAVNQARTTYRETVSHAHKVYDEAMTAARATLEETLTAAGRACHRTMKEDQ